MANLILPRRFTSQPQYPVESNKHGFIWLPHTGDVGSTNLIQTAGTQITSASLGGVSAYNAGSTTNRIEYNTPYADGDMTIVAVCSFISVGVGRNITGAYKIAGNAVANYLSLEASGRISAVSSDNNNWAVAAGRISEVNKLYSIVGTFKSGGKRAVFVNGVKDAENATGRTPAAMEKLLIGSYLASGSYGSPMTGHINLSIVLPVYLSDEEARELSANPWQIFRRSPQVLYFDTAGGGATTLLPSLFTDGDTFHAATVSVGAVTLTPALYSDGDTFHAATVSQGGAPQTLTPDLYADGDTFHAATVGRGAVTLTPSLYADGDTFYAATVSNGAVTLTPSLFSDGDTFHTATVGRGAVALTPSLYADGDTFHAATVANGAITLSPELFSDGDTFHAATVSPGAVSLAPALVSDGDTFYTHAVVLEGGPQTLSPELLVDADTFHAATVTPGAVTLSPSLYTDADTFHAAEVAAGYNLQPEAYADGDTFYPATVSGGAVTLAPELLVDADTFHSPTLTFGQILAPALFADADTFHAPSVYLGVRRTVELLTAAARDTQLTAPERDTLLESRNAIHG